MQTWLHKNDQDSGFFRTEEAKEYLKSIECPYDKRQSEKLLTVLFDRYWGASFDDRKHLLKLMIIAGTKGFSFQGRCRSGQPVFFHVLQFRLSKLVISARMAASQFHMVSM